MSQDDEKVVKAAATGAAGGVFGLLTFLAGLPLLKAVVLTGMFLFAGVTWQHQDKIIDAVAASVEARNRAATNRVHATALSDAVGRSKQITSVLRGAMTDIGAARATLLEFHNGLESLRGVPFLFMSASAETVAVGVSTERDSIQRIPIGTIMDWLPAFLTHQCVIQHAAGAPAATGAEMEKHGTKHAVACPVFADKTREPIAFISASYTAGFEPTGQDYAAAEKRLQQAADLVGATLAAYLEQVGR